MVSHHVTQNQCSCDIIVIVLDRLCNRFSNCFESRKMNHRLNVRLFIKNCVHRLFIADIRLVKFHAFSGDLLHPFQSFFRRII